MEISVFKETTDDWRGNYQTTIGLQLVNVMFTQTGPDPKNYQGEWRVCVWGDDDCGLERDYAPAEESAALHMFYQIIGWETVGMAQLIDHGFTSA